MIMKVLAFAATTSKNSINKQLANYVAKQIEGAQVELLDINDYEIPLFSEDREKELGQPALAKAFYQKLGEADIIVISFAEHNGSYAAAYKNLLIGRLALIGNYFKISRLLCWQHHQGRVALQLYCRQLRAQRLTLPPI